MDTKSAYRETRERIIALVAQAGPDAGNRSVPACPDWSVNDVLAHLAGVCDDLLGGRLEGVASDPWTQAQVEARRDRDTFQLMEEWNDLGPRIEAALGSELPKQMVFDTVTHEHDLRTALEAPGSRETDAVEIGFRFVAAGFGGQVSALELPAVSVRADRSERVYGDGPPTVTLAASSFDLMRSISGRRTAAQILALGWDGADDPSVYLPAFAFEPFRLPSEPVE